MERSGKLTFSLGNMFLAAVPVAVACALIGSANAKVRLAVAVPLLILASAPAIGALSGGWKGMVLCVVILVVLCGLRSAPLLVGVLLSRVN